MQTRQERLLQEAADRKRAGVIPYIVDEEGVIHMKFMKAKKAPEGGWQIAKGGIKKGEDKRTAAFREAGEEIGLFEPNCTNVRSLGSFGGITLFVAEIIDKNKFGDPQPEETAGVAWLTMDEFKQSGRMSQKHIVKQAHQLIQQMIKGSPKSMVSSKR